MQTKYERESLKIIIKQKGSCAGILCRDCWFNNQPVRSHTYCLNIVSVENRMKIAKEMLREEKLERICREKK